VNIDQPIRHAILPLAASMAFVVVAVVSVVSIGECLAAEPRTPDAGRRGELVSLVRQDCGSCHGLTLKGGLGPALLPQALKDKPATALKATIMQGRPGTAMPPWRDFLTDDEADWIVANLQKGFPDAR
jgi:cytochrome c55X